MKTSLEIFYDKHIKKEKNSCILFEDLVKYYEAFCNKYNLDIANEIPIMLKEMIMKSIEIKTINKITLGFTLSQIKGFSFKNLHRLRT